MAPSIKTDDDVDAAKLLAGGEYHRVETPRGSDLPVTAGDDSADKNEAKIALGSTGSTADSDDKKKQEEDGGGAAKKKKGPPKSFNFSQLYRYATAYDKFLLGVGICMAVCNGALFPLMAIVFGNVLNGFATIPIDQDAINKASLNYLHFNCSA